MVKEGSVTVNLLNHQEQIAAGEGFLILPGMLHSIRSGTEAQNAVYETFFFDPCLITGFRGSYFEKQYYQPEILSRNGLRFWNAGFSRNFRRSGWCYGITSF